jgi:antitoxin component YwqK of YwqJK toxin-antitoxin module
MDFRYLLLIFLFLGCRHSKDTIYIDYHENGKIDRIGYLKNNKLYGTVYRYFSDGELHGIMNYRKGKIHGKQLYYLFGKLQRIEHFKNDILHGLTEIYDINCCGTIAFSGYLRNGKRSSLWYQYHNGYLYSIEKYKNGKLTEVVYSDSSIINNLPYIECPCNNMDRYGR